jgi:hypothetical protein
MKKLIVSGSAMLLILMMLVSCSSKSAPDSNSGMIDQESLTFPYSNFQDTQKTLEIDVEGNETPPSVIHWAAVPSVFVNDTYFRIFADEMYDPIPEFDDTWISLGNIQSAVPVWESPAQNFQTNNEAMLGAEIYYSAEGRIPVSNTTWGDPLDEEIIGDSVIVILEGSRLFYISEEAHEKVIEVMDKVVRSSLMIDGNIYSLMGSFGGGNSPISSNHIFLGEITSTVPIDEYPTEDLQANREVVVGMKVYREPPGDDTSVIVFNNAGYYYRYSLLPGTTVPGITIDP